MNKQDVITFFDHYASTWDADMIRNESVINTILDNGGVTTGCTVLDVACGTGVVLLTAQCKKRNRCGHLTGDGTHRSRQISEQSD